MSEDVITKQEQPTAAPPKTWREAETTREALNITFDNIKGGIAKLREDGWEGIRQKVEEGAQKVDRFVLETVKYWSKHPVRTAAFAVALGVAAHGIHERISAAQAATPSSGTGYVETTDKSVFGPPQVDGGEGPEPQGAEGGDDTLPSAERFTVKHVLHSDFGGDLNIGVYDNEGKVNVSSDAILHHFEAAQEALKGDPDLPDGMMRTLQGDLSDDFGIDAINRSEGGLGFDNANMLMTDDDLRNLKPDQEVFQVDKDGDARALVNVGEIQDLPGVLRDMFEQNASRLGQDSSTVDIQGQVNAALAQLGVYDVEGPDADTMTDFKVHLTSFGEPDANETQHETAKAVTFSDETGFDQATFDNQSSRTSALVAMVVEPDGDVRVQAFAQDATPDHINSQADNLYGDEDEGAKVRANGSRLVPVGTPASSQTEVPETPPEKPEATPDPIKPEEPEKPKEPIPDPITPEKPEKPPEKPEKEHENKGHGNNEDFQDDDNPGKGSGGPNAEPKIPPDEDEGQKGNQGDSTPGGSGGGGKPNKP